MENQKIQMQDIIMIPTRCQECGLEGLAPTLIQIMEDETTYLSQMVKEKGHAEILCIDCAEKAVENLS